MNVEIDAIPKIGHLCEIIGDEQPYLVQIYCDWSLNSVVMNVFVLDRHGSIVSCRYSSVMDENSRGFRMGYFNLILTGLGLRLPKAVLFRMDYDRSRQETPNAIVHSNLCDAQHRDWYRDLFCNSNNQVA